MTLNQEGQKLTRLVPLLDEWGDHNGKVDLFDNSQAKELSRFLVDFFLLFLSYACASMDRV